MNYRRLGDSDIEVSEISLGCWTMGGINWVDGVENGWANVDEDEIVRSIKVAIDADVNHFDNADVYGNGRAERMLARAFQKLGLKSEDFIIASKTGHFPGTAAHAYEPTHIRHQCEQSLINLKRDYIDLYYLHHGDFGEDDEYLLPAADVLDDLVAEGKIRLKGQSAYSEEDFEKTVPVIGPSVLQSWAHAMDNHFIKSGSRVAELLAHNELSFVAFSPLNQGLLLDKFSPDSLPTFEPGDHRRTNPKFTFSALQKLKPQMAQLKERFGDQTIDLSAVALRFVLEHANVACVIPGFRNENQVRCNLASSNKTLSTEDLEFISSIFEL
ncbi:MAG: aldo/keto reductase [Opitutaceae bacterium]|nr:aldo/keto reductase [Opitutaceae bacterium]